MADSRRVYLLVGIAAVCLSWLLLEYWWKPRRIAGAFRRQGIHGYRYMPVVGNMWQLNMMTERARSKPMSLSHDIAHRALPFFHETIHKYGKICLTWFGETPQLIVADPELVKEALSNKLGHFLKPPSTPVGKLLALGLISMDGEKWASQRRMLNPAFHLEKLKGMQSSFSLCCSELIKRWKNSIGSEGSCELDVWEEFQNLSGDIISRTAFGSSFEEGRFIFQLQKEQAELIISHERTIFIPGMRFLPTKKNQRIKEIYKRIVSMLNDIIDKREKEMKMGTAKNDDLLGILLESNKARHIQDGEGMTREDVIEECKLFYFAGQETTSNLLTWAMVLLSLFPIWQTRAREEVDEVFGEQTPTFDGLSHLKTVSMILNEVLRLYPPAASTVRHTYRPAKLGDIALPAGVRLVLPVLHIHHDPKIWGDDAHEFNPERFSRGIANASKNQLAFFPFGWGPRICIGQQFALIEVKMALAMILQNFSFELSPTYRHGPHNIITLQPQYGAQIILHHA